MNVFIREAPTEENTASKRMVVKFNNCTNTGTNTKRMNTDTKRQLQMIAEEYQFM